MVLPEDPGTSRSRRRTGRATMLAVIAVVAGLVALAALTSPDPEALAVATTTTSTTSTTIEPLEAPIDLDNFSIGQITTGEPLEWDQVATFASVYPDSLTEYNGVLYLFGPASPTWADRPDGLRAWRSADGVAWERLDVVIERDHVIAGVRATSHGLVALETSGGTLKLWRSEDGMTWDLNEATIELESGFATAHLLAVGSVEESTVVFTHSYVDTGQLIGERLLEADIDIDLFSTEWTVHPRLDDVRIQIYGPLGLPAGELTGSDLGLSEDEVRWLRGGFMSGEQTQTWLVTDHEWERSDFVEHSWIDRLLNGPDGDLIAYGSDSIGPAMWRSSDGFTWDRMTSIFSTSELATWRDRLVGVRMWSVPEVVSTTDGKTSETTGLADHFPRQVSWSVGPLGAGGGGIAVVVHGWDSIPTMTDRSPGPLSLRLGEGRPGFLTLDFGRGTIEVETGDTSHTWSMYPSGPPPDGIEVDLATQSVTFSDIATGEALGIFSFDDLNEAQDSYWSGASWHRPTSHRAFAFTPDGETWTIQDIGDVFGEDTWIAEILVTDTHVIAVEGEFVAPEGYRFNLWAAPIP